MNRLLKVRRETIKISIKKKCVVNASVSRHRQKRIGDLYRQLKHLAQECREHSTTPPPWVKE